VVDTDGDGRQELAFSLHVQATDGQLTSAYRTVTVYIEDTNETPTDINPNGSLTFAEGSYNGVNLVSFSRVDQDGGDTATYSLVNNAGGRFAINAAGQLTGTATALNYEAATSHVITVRVTDSGGLTYDEAFTINVTNVPEAPTDLWPDRTLSFSENTGVGAGLAWIAGADPENNITGFSLLNDAGGRFALDANGLLKVGGTGLNYESGANHSILVRATDASGLTYDEWLSVGITNVNETPTDIIPVGTFAINEGNQNGVNIASFNRADPDAGDTATYSLTNNAGGRFAISAAGQLTGGPTALNYEAATSHAITVRVTDAGGLFYDESFTVTVNNVNEAPTDLWPDRTLSFQENIGVGTGLAWIGGADPESNIASFSLLNDAGGRFALDANGLLKVGGSGLNYEAGANHSILVRATDTGGLVYDKWLSVSITNVNEAPTDLWPDRTLSWGEGNYNGQGLAWFGRADVDAGDGATYSLYDSAGGRYAMRSDGLLMGGPTSTNYEAAT
ncbi:unnamed protein product, partial [Phaeothamnion confervicola]